MLILTAIHVFQQQDDTKTYSTTFQNASCTIDLPQKAFLLPDELEKNYYIDKKIRRELQITNDSTFITASHVLDTLVSNYVDVDNTISSSKIISKNEIRVSYLNGQRGTHWCSIARMILEHPILKDTDVWILNEFDLGMARSENLYTSRMFSYALGLNYAFGVEFLELTHGNEAEKRFADHHRLEDEWSIHGNAILSRWPIRNARLLRTPGSNIYYRRKSWETAEGFESRLGGRMTLFADLQMGSRIMTVSSSHLQARNNNFYYAKLVTAFHKLFASNYWILGGDIWPEFCGSVGLESHIKNPSPMVSLSSSGSLELKGSGGDYICSNLPQTPGSVITVPAYKQISANLAAIFSDHQIVSVCLKNN